MKRLIKTIRIFGRAKRLFVGGQNDYGIAVKSCARVSAINPSLCFLVERMGAFGGPKISSIERPDEIVMFEHFNGVIIRDGIIYELSKNDV